MEAIADFMARRPAWQVFLLLVIPFVALNYFVSANLDFYASTPDASEAELEERATLTTLLSIFSTFLLHAWWLLVGLSARRHVEESRRQRVWAASLAAIFAASFFSFGYLILPHQAMGVPPSVHLVLFAGALAGICYLLVFSARNVIMAENTSTTSFSEYSGVFFSLLFFPIGAWLVQPRLNRLVEGQ